jgi:hypothetical protein
MNMSKAIFIKWSHNTKQKQNKNKTINKNIYYLTLNYLQWKQL